MILFPSWLSAEFSFLRRDCSHPLGAFLRVLVQEDEVPEKERSSGTWVAKQNQENLESRQKGSAHRDPKRFTHIQKGNLSAGGKSTPTMPGQKGDQGSQQPTETFPTGSPWNS